jgi:hypothetical protein
MTEVNSIWNYYRAELSAYDVGLLACRVFSPEIFLPPSLKGELECLADVGVRWAATRQFAFFL